MKRVWMMFIVLLLAFSVTSCGGAEPEQEEKKTVEKAAVSDTADSEEEFSDLVLAYIEIK